MNELDLFAAVIAIAEPGERAALLERECAGRPDLRNRIDQLVSAHFKSNALLDVPETGSDQPPRQRRFRDRVFAHCRRGCRGRSSPVGTSCSSRSARGVWARSGWPTRPNRSSAGSRSS